MNADLIQDVINLDGLGMLGQIVLPTVAVENITVPVTTVQHQIALPFNMTTAKFVAVTASKIEDLSLQVSTAAGSTVLAVPLGCTLIIYSATALYFNSALGGTFRVAIG